MCERLITCQSNNPLKGLRYLGSGAAVQVQRVETGGQVISENQSNEQEKRKSYNASVRHSTVEIWRII